MIALSPRRVLRSEWIKLTTLRSTIVALIVAVLMMVALSVLASWETVADWREMTPADRESMQVSSRVLLGRLFAQLAIGVLGVLAVSSEYASGMIRATLAAVPRRLPVLWAKLAVIVLLTLVPMIAASFASFFAGTAILAEHWDFSLSDPGVLRAVVMSGLCLTVVGLLGAGLAFVLRNTAAALSTLFGILLVLPVVSKFAPEVAQYLPTNLMDSLDTPMMEQHMVDPGPAFALLCAYLVAAVAAAAAVLTRKDA